MFTRCIHCTEDLGTNESVEHFQVGSKLAFDSGKGRLWVICAHCARWNLTPLDERREAVGVCGVAIWSRVLAPAHPDSPGVRCTRGGGNWHRIRRHLFRRDHFG